MTKEELKPIDTSKYKIAETVQILKMTKEEFEKENIRVKTKIISLENENRAILKELANTASGGISVLKTVVRNKEKLIEAKEILRKFIDAKSIEEICVAESEAEQFLINLKRYENGK